MMNPPVINPVLSWMRRAFPAACGPDVVVAFVAVIAADPHIAPIRGGSPDFNDWRRWTYANHNLRKRSHRTKCEGK